MSDIDTLTMTEQKEIKDYCRNRLLDNDELIVIDDLPKWLADLETIRRKYEELKSRFLEQGKQHRASLAIEIHLRREAERKAMLNWEALQRIFAEANIDWFNGPPPIEKLIEKIREWKEVNKNGERATE